MKELIKKLINKETITYIIFGVGSTGVNLAVFKLFDLIFTAFYFTLIDFPPPLLSVQMRGVF